MQNIVFVEDSNHPGDPDKSGLHLGSDRITYAYTSPGLKITAFRRLQHSPLYQALGQVLLVTSPVYQTQTSLVYHSVCPLNKTLVSPAPASAYYASAPAPAPAQAYVLAPAPAQAPIVDPTRYTLIEPQSIHNNAGNEYTWQQDTTNGNYNFRSDQGNVIYSAMHVNNISVASRVLDGKNFSADLVANGVYRTFQGLRLGHFVYFNFTNQDIFVGGIGNWGSLRVPANNPSQVSEIHPQTSPASKITYVNDSESRPQNLALLQSKSDLEARDDAIYEAQRLIIENKNLKIAPQRQLESIKKLEHELLFARREIDRINRQNELDKNESDRRARNADAEKAFNESKIMSSLFRAERAAEALRLERERAAEARADAERARASAAEAQAALRREKDQAAAEALRLERERAAQAERERAAADQRARDAQAVQAARAANLQKQLAAQAAKDLAAAAKDLADERERAAAAALAEAKTRAAQAAAEAQAAETARAAEAARATAAERHLAAAETARDAAVRAAQAAAQAALAAEEKNKTLERSITHFKDSLENIKTQFENLKNLFRIEVTKTKLDINFGEYENNNSKLKWIVNSDELRMQNTNYNIFLKFSAFSEGQRSEEEEQKALSQIALLKLKLIQLGRDNHDKNFLYNQAAITGFLNDTTGKKGDNSLLISDRETQKFCEEYFSLGQQYHKILEEEKSKSDSDIKKMMSCELKKRIICYNNKSAQEYLGSSQDYFETEFTSVSGSNFDSISEAHSHSHSHSSDKTNDDAKKNDDKIILLNSFIISLEKACKGRKEIKEKSGDQIEISPEVAKVFVTLDDSEAKKLWDSLSYEKQIQLKDFLEQELLYSKAEKERVVGKSKIYIDECVDARKKQESNWTVLKFSDILITKQRKQELKIKFDAPTKEVSDFFKKREEKCQELITNLTLKDRPQAPSPDASDESSVGGRNNSFYKSLESLINIIKKFNNDFKQILGGENDEFFPAPEEEAGGTRVRAPRAAPAHAAAAPRPAPPPQERNLGNNNLITSKQIFETIAKYKNS